MNYNNLCICFQPAIKIDAFCFQFLILDWRNCWQGCWTEKEYLTEEVRILEEAQEAKEAKEAKAQPTNSRNGHLSSKAKGSHASAHLGDGFKPSSARSNSTDRIKPSSTRGISSDRSLASGRATPPNSSLLSSDKSGNIKQGGERDRSAERTLSSADSRDTFNGRASGVPLTSKRPPVLKAEPAEEDDNSATPTQAQHNRGPSENQFRLDLTNPPSSPFSIKF